MAPAFVNDDLERLMRLPDIPIDALTVGLSQAQGAAAAMRLAMDSPDSDAGEQEQDYYSGLAVRLAAEMIRHLEGGIRVVLRVTSAYTEDCATPECEGTASNGALISTGGTVPLISCRRCGGRFLMDPGDILSG